MRLLQRRGGRLRRCHGARPDPGAGRPVVERNGLGDHLDVDDPDSATVATELVGTSVTTGGDGVEQNPGDAVQLAEIAGQDARDVRRRGRASGRGPRLTTRLRPSGPYAR